MIHTSYHAKVKALREAGLVPVNISLYYPRFIAGPYPSYKALAPTKEILEAYKTAGNKAEYRIRFAEILSKLNPRQVVDELQALGCGKHVVLCCYEKSGDFCHRHLVADWLQENLNIPVDEITFSSPIN